MLFREEYEKTYQEITMKYKVTGAFVELHAGVLTLTKQQARDRMHNLRKLKGNSFEIVKPVQFKQGEEIGFDGDITHQLADLLGDASGKNGATSENVQTSAQNDTLLPDSDDVGTPALAG